MKKMSETIIFFGSGPVAAASLAYLIDNFNIEAVITKSVPPHHRGSAPVEELAKHRSVPTYFANNRGELDTLVKQQRFSSRVGLVVDYGVIMSAEVINYFELGIVNSHFSLLPKWRGADPITFAVLNGDSKTGVSLMLIVPKLDEGDLLSQDTLAIKNDITTPQLTGQLVDLSNKMLARDLPRYVSGDLKPYPQPDQPSSYSRKLTKEDGLVDWHKPAEVIEREIRAFIEWPKSRTILAGKDVVITKAHVTNRSGEPGTVIIDNKQLIIACGKGALVIEQLKPAGKPAMTAEAFLAGYRNFL